jgi:hypothetical protein
MEPMFQIGLRLTTLPYLCGLEALDWRRKLGLPDSANTVTLRTGGVSEMCAVDEAFARAYFPPHVRTVVYEVSHHLLSKGDVEEAGSGLWLHDSLDSERLRQLWLSCWLIKKSEVRARAIAEGMAAAPLGVEAANSPEDMRGLFGAMHGFLLDLMEWDRRVEEEEDEDANALAPGLPAAMHGRLQDILRSVEGVAS